MSESLTHIKEGPIDEWTKVRVIDCVASEAILMWSVVELADLPAGEDFPRVKPTDAVTDRAYGVVVGPLRESGRAADAAGDIVKVQQEGRAKVRVDGSAITLGAALSAKTAGRAGLAAASHFPFATALRASSTDGDIIPVELNCPALIVF